MQINQPGYQAAGYTPEQVGVMLGVKTSTIYAYISRKELRALKVGHRRFVSDQQIKEFSERRMTGEYVDHTYAHGPAN